MSKANKKIKLKENKVNIFTFLEPAGYLTPFLLGILIFTLYPFINVIVISFKENYNLLTGAYHAIGANNYMQVVHDPNFLNGLKNTGLYVLIVVPITTLISLLFATLLNNVERFKGFYQTAYFLPMVTSA